MNAHVLTTTRSASSGAPAGVSPSDSREPASFDESTSFLGQPRVSSQYRRGTSSIYRRPPRPDLQVAPSGLLSLDRLEQGLEVPRSEAPGPLPLDDLEEQRRTVADVLGEDLQQVTVLVAVDEDPEPPQLV